MAKKENLPPGIGRDLGSNPHEGAANQRDKSFNPDRARSGSSNREDGFDMHPHKGDHGEAQKQGSPREEDYYGKERGFPSEPRRAIKDEGETK